MAGQACLIACRTNKEDNSRIALLSRAAPKEGVK